MLARGCKTDTGYQHYSGIDPASTNDSADGSFKLDFNVADRYGKQYEQIRKSGFFKWPKTIPTHH